MGFFSRLKSKKKAAAAEAEAEAAPAEAASPYRFVQPGRARFLEAQAAKEAAEQHEGPEEQAAQLAAAGTSAGHADGTDLGRPEADSEQGSSPSAVCPLTPDVSYAPLSPTAGAEALGQHGAGRDSSCGSCSSPVAGGDDDGASQHSGSGTAAVAPGSVYSGQSSVAARGVDWAAEAGKADDVPGGDQLSAQRQIRQEMGAEVEARLRELFVDFASFGASKQRLEEMDGARFTKLARECGLLCRRFTRGHADVAFTTAKRRKGLRRLTFGEFCTALRLAAFRKQCPLSQVVTQVVCSRGPVLSNVTTAETVRLYDDLSTWTGTQFQVAAQAALAVDSAPAHAAAASSAGSGSTSGVASGLATPGCHSRLGSLAELLKRQQSAKQDFIDPQKAAAEAAAADKRRHLAQGLIREAEAAATAAVAKAAVLESAARDKAWQAAAAAAAATAAIGQNDASTSGLRAEAASLHEQAAVQQEAARQAERDAAAALRRAAMEEEKGRAAAEAALGVATDKQRLAADAATSAWAAAASASEAAEHAAAALTEQAMASAAEGGDGPSAAWAEDSRRQVAAASAEAEEASMAAIVAAKRDAEAAMLEALMRADEAEAVVEASRAEAAAASEQLEAAKAEGAALLAAAAAAEAAAEGHAGRKKEAEARALHLKEVAAQAAVQRRKAAARAKQEAERAAAAAEQRRLLATDAAQEAANASVRAQVGGKCFLGDIGDSRRACQGSPT